MSQTHSATLSTSTDDIELLLPGLAWKGEKFCVLENLNQMKFHEIQCLSSANFLISSIVMGYLQGFDFHKFYARRHF